MAPSKVELTETELQLFQLIESNAVEEVKLLLKEEKLNIDCLDDHGMTPLQHAAYRGRRELCDILLMHGADVNSQYHEYGYTALMFAGISGHEDVLLDLLSAGAKTTPVNSVGRTASQMAGFVGNHGVVAVINNYVPRERVDYYTVCHGLETESMLPSHLAGPLHKLIISSSIHPVRISFYLQKNLSLVKEETKVRKVIDVMIEKEMKASDVNEILALKLHYIGYVLKTFAKSCENSESCRDKEGKQVGVDLIKRFLKGRQSDNFPEFNELFLRQVIREFPYAQSAIMQQLARSLAPVKVGDEPTAFALLDSTFNGQRSLSEYSMCATCGVLKAPKKCSACKGVQYCDQRCQKLHWFTHKKECFQLAEQETKVSSESKAEDNTS